MTRYLFLLLLAFPLVAVRAEDSGAEEEAATPLEEHERSERFLDTLDKRLELRKEQRTKIKEILDAARPEAQSIQKQMKELHKRMEKLARAQNEKIRALLDDEQKPKFDEFSVEMRRHLHGRTESPWRRPGPPQSEEMRRRNKTSEGDPRELPPPEMWHDGQKAPEKRE